MTENRLQKLEIPTYHKLFNHTHMEKYYLVATDTGETILSSEDKEILEKCRFGDELIVDEKTWREEYKDIEPSYMM